MQDLLGAQAEAVLLLAAMLAQPLSNIEDWEAVAAAQKQDFLRGIGS